MKPPQLGKYEHHFCNGCLRSALQSFTQSQEKRVAYNVEWRTPEGAAKQMKGHKVSASTKVVLGNLPSGLLCFRVGARVAGAGTNDDQDQGRDVKLWGPWAELEAGED
eukprot:s1584_g14.t1